jgi:hypothetical protein
LSTARRSPPWMETFMPLDCWPKTAHTEHGTNRVYQRCSHSSLTFPAKRFPRQPVISPAPGSSNPISLNFVSVRARGYDPARRDPRARIGRPPTGSVSVPESVYRPPANCAELAQHAIVEAQLEGFHLVRASTPCKMGRCEEAAGTGAPNLVTILVHT